MKKYEYVTWIAFQNTGFITDGGIDFNILDAKTDC